MYDIIVIGAGVAGMNAALYALRSGKKVLIIEGDAVGGQIANSPKVENLPSIKEISGGDFADAFFNQVTDWGAETEYDEVTNVKKCGNVFKVTTAYGEFESKAVIAALGVKHKHLSVPGENRFLGKGVYYCALCDGPFYKGKEVALIGDGNTAMQYGVVLSNICKKVYILTLTDKFFGDKVLEQRLRERENISILPYTSVLSFEGDAEMEKVVYKELASDKVCELNVPAAFVAIGQVPDNGRFKELCELDAQGYFVTNDDMSTKTAGFFAAGDCRKKAVRQVATAVSDGAIAAVSATEYVDKL